MAINIESDLAKLAIPVEDIKLANLGSLGFITRSGNIFVSQDLSHEITYRRILELNNITYNESQDFSLTIVKDYCIAKYNINYGYIMAPLRITKDQFNSIAKLLMNTGGRVKSIVILGCDCVLACDSDLNIALDELSKNIVES